MKFAVAVFLLLLAFPGAARAQHGIRLTCTASTSSGIAGYNFYRSTTNYSSFVKINSALQPSCAYFDPASGLSANTTYYYLATAVDSNGNESQYSNQSVTTPRWTSAVAPIPPTDVQVSAQ